VEPDGGPEVSAELTRAVLAGEANGASARAVVISAAVRLYAARVAGLREGIELASGALADGRGRAALDAMVGT
jgi:anthranilate phosphoribosyltransferase